MRQPRSSSFSNLRKDGNTIDELRLISVTSFLFKLLEIVIKNKFNHCADVRVIKKLKDIWHEFRPKLGTEPQILNIETVCGYQVSQSKLESLPLIV